MSLTNNFCTLTCPLELSNFSVRLGFLSIYSVPLSSPHHLFYSFPSHLTSAWIESTPSGHPWDARENQFPSKVPLTKTNRQQAATDVTPGRDSDRCQPRALCNCQVFPGHSVTWAEPWSSETESMLQGVHSKVNRIVLPFYSGHHVGGDMLL